MDTDKDFQDFWQAYKPDEMRFPNRRTATLGQWRTRSRAAQQAMMQYVKDQGAPKWKNPYFFVQDFPEPEPKDYNGARLLPNEPLVIAKYNDCAGLYTRREAELFGMNILRPFEQ
jgi:hypothetical protein